MIGSRIQEFSDINQHVVRFREEIKEVAEISSKNDAGKYIIRDTFLEEQIEIAKFRVIAFETEQRRRTNQQLIDAAVQIMEKFPLPVFKTSRTDIDIAL